MVQEQFFVTTPPQQLSRLRCRPVTAAHLAYQLGPGARLLRTAHAPQLQNGLMVVVLGPQLSGGSLGFFCQEVVQECMTRHFSGVVLDFDRRLPFLEQLAARLDEVLLARRLRLFVPESYALCAPNAGVLLSSALSGGSLDLRLKEAGERFGRDRIVLALEASAEDFRLPSPTGCGAPLSQDQLKEMLDRMRPCVFFSVPLCARYFTYMSRDSGAHFVLFDDGDTMRRKIQVGRQQGVRFFFLPWTQLDACLPIDGTDTLG